MPPMPSTTQATDPSGTSGSPGPKRWKANRSPVTQPKRRLAPGQGRNEGLLVLVGDRGQVRTAAPAGAVGPVEIDRAMEHAVRVAVRPAQPPVPFAHERSSPVAVPLRPGRRVVADRWMER